MNDQAPLTLRLLADIRDLFNKSASYGPMLTTIRHASSAPTWPPYWIDRGGQRLNRKDYVTLHNTLLEPQHSLDDLSEVNEEKMNELYAPRTITPTAALEEAQRAHE
jgi:hypothetical protein